MADSIFPTLRMAFNQALGGIRLGFGRITAPAKQERPEVDGFLNRLEEVLGIELQEAEPATQPQELAAEPRVIVARQVITDSVAGPAVRIQATAQPATKAPRKRKAAIKAEPATPATLKAATGKKRSGRSAPRAKREKKKIVPAKSTALVLVPKAKTAAETALAEQELAENPPRPARPKRQALGPQGILVCTALVHVPRLKPVPPANAQKAGHPLPDFLGAVQGSTPVYGRAPRQLQAQTLADQPPARQKKAGEDDSPFSVSVGQVYDGPLDLLLDLIRRQDIDIYDIPIATITAQFLSYVNQLKASDVDVAGEFIYTASLLIHIKSKMLLPRSPSGPDDAPEDPRRELVERLLEHERFKNAAQMLQQKQMLEAATWSNPGFREFQDDAAAEPEMAADTVDLVRIFRDILERARKMPVLDLQEDSVTVGQMIQFLARRLSIEDKPVALRKLLSHTRSERARVAMFLALLELVRLQAVLLRQDRAFSEIFIKKHTGFDAVMNDGVANALDDWR